MHADRIEYIISLKQQEKSVRITANLLGARIKVEWEGKFPT